jgi:PAS domain S-box-containing protein
MSISSKTPPTERAPKSATGSRACQAAAPAREASLHPGNQLSIQPGVLDQLQDAVFTADLQGIITSCNQGIDRYGFASKDLLGKNIADAYGVEKQMFLASGAIASVLEQGRFEGELRCRNKSGQDVNVHLCLTLFWGSRSRKQAKLLRRRTPQLHPRRSH